jgi:hypothetical protein
MDLFSLLRPFGLAHPNFEVVHQANVSPHGVHTIFRSGFLRQRLPYICRCIFGSFWQSTAIYAVLIRLQWHFRVFRLRKSKKTMIWTRNTETMGVHGKPVYFWALLRPLHWWDCTGQSAADLSILTLRSYQAASLRPQSAHLRKACTSTQIERLPNSTSQSGSSATSPRMCFPTASQSITTKAVRVSTKSAHAQCMVRNFVANNSYSMQPSQMCGNSRASSGGNLRLSG